jgi:hypothetical protein
MRMSIAIVLCLACLSFAGCGGSNAIDAGETATRSDELSSSCTGLVPASLGSASSSATLPGLSDYDDPLVGDGVGSLAFFYGGWPNNLHVDLLQPDGSQRSFDELQANQFGPSLLPQASGYQLLHGDTVNPNELRTYSTRGDLLSRTAVEGAQHIGTAIDYGGGSLVASHKFTNYVSGSYWTYGWSITAQRFSSSGLARAPMAPVAADPSGNSSIVIVQGGVSLGGLTLVAWVYNTPGGATYEPLVGRWLDRNGTPLTAAFTIAAHGPMYPLKLEPLLDGSIAVSTAFRWVARVPPGSTAVTAAPQFLQVRPHTRLALRPNARGYAVLFDQPYPDATAGCSAAVHVSLFTPSGVKCGSLDLPADRDGIDPSHNCFSTAAMGREGTVVVRTRGTNQSYTPVTNHRWWRQLLR